MNEYDKNGFVIFDKPVISVDLLIDAKSRINNIMRGEYDTGLSHWGITNQDNPSQLQRISQIHICDQSFHNLLTQSKMGKLMAGYVGARKLKIWGTQLYIKPSESRSEGHVGWHRDSQHITFYRKGLFTLWIPLDGSYSELGPLKYVQGSHMPGAFKMPKGGEEQDLDNEKARIIDGNNNDWKEIEVIVPQGGMSIHHWDLIHGSATNYAQQARYALSVGVATEELELVPEEWHFGFHAILDNPLYCPVIFG